jgi:hypothetical protein
VSFDAEFARLPMSVQERVESAATIMILERISESSRAACKDAEANLLAARDRWSKACEHRARFLSWSQAERDSALSGVSEATFIRDMGHVIAEHQRSVLRTSTIAAGALEYMSRVTDCLELAIQLHAIGM